MNNDDTTAAGRRLTRAELTERAAWLGALADAANDEAAGIRAELEGQARAEAEQGCVPSWRLRGVGIVSGRESHNKVTVSDPAAFLAWVTERHPEQLDTIVRPAFVKTMTDKGTKPSGNPEVPGEVVNKDGEVVPGLTFTAGGKFAGISITVNDEAKQVFALAAGMALTEAMRGAGSPFAADMRQALEAVELLAGEPAGADEVPA